MARAAKELLDGVPGIADARLNRDDARPEFAVRIDRAKAALFGLTGTSVANTIATNVAGTQAAMFREGGNEYPIVVRLRENERQAGNRRRRCSREHGAGSGAAAKNLMNVESAVGPVSVERKNSSGVAYVEAEPERISALR